MGKKIGVFGGSFDPIHYGHLLMAEQCREQAALDEVIFIPAHQSPLKSRAPLAEPRDRCEMLRLATSGHESFSLDAIELDRPGPSFTVDTLRELSTRFADDQLFLILGSDALKDFARWREPAEILKLAFPLVVERPGEIVSLESIRQFFSPERWQAAKQFRIKSPLCEISSSEMRHRVLEGRSIRYMTPRAVEMYIRTNGLYRPA